MCIILDSNILFWKKLSVYKIHNVWHNLFKIEMGLIDNAGVSS